MPTPVNDPITAADRMSRADVTAPAACPLTKIDMQLIPARYAYAEESADAAFASPHYPGNFRPIGIRNIRNGYLYLFHSDSPDILQECRVSAGGAITKTLQEGDGATPAQRASLPDSPAIIVPRRGSVQVLFLPVALTAKTRRLLMEWSNYRNTVMQSVSLSSLCPEAGGTHLATKEALEATLEHPPESQTEPTEDDTLPPWYWARPDGDTEPFAHRISAYEKDHAYLIVDDITGQITDLLDAWIVVDEQHNQWLEKNDARYYPACFINALIELDNNRLTDLAGAFADNEDDPDMIAALARIKAAPDAQKTKLKALVADYPDYVQRRQYAQRVQNTPPPIRDKNAKGSPELARLLQMQSDLTRAKQRIDETIDSLSQALGITPDQLVTYMDGVREYQQTVLEGNLTGEQGIADMVQLEPMQAWLEKAEITLKTFEDEKNAIIESLHTLLPAFYQQGHLYDRQQEATYQQLLGLDNAVITVMSEHAQTTGDFHFLRRFYFDAPGHQHLLAFELTPAVFSGSVNQIINTFKAMLEAAETPQTHQQWHAMLANNPQLRFASLTPASRAELGNRLASLSVIARQELVTLVDQATDAHLHARLETLFTRMGPGLRAHLLNNQLIYQVDLVIGSEAELTRHDTLVSDVDQLEARYQQVKKKQKQLENGYRKASSRERRQHKAQYDTRMRELRAEKKQLRTGIQNHIGELTQRSPLQGDGATGALVIGGLKNTAEGRAIAAELADLRAIERRYGPEKLLDYARGQLHGSAGASALGLGKLGLVSFVGVISAVGTIDAFKQWWRKDDLGSVLNATAGVFGTVGAAASVATMMGSARLNYYYATISQSDTILTRLARVNVWGGTVAAWSGFFSASADGIKQFMSIMDALDKGETWTGRGITMAGDSMIIYGSARIGRVGAAGLYHLLWKKTVGVTWVSVNRSMLSIAGGLFRGMNVWIWIGTALVLAGSWEQNRARRTAVQAWCEKSAWGLKNAGWSAVQQRNHLAQVIYRPALAMKAEREAVGWDFSQLKLRLELPGTTTLRSDNFKWVVLSEQGVEWDMVTKDWNERMIVTQSESNTLALETTLLPSELETRDALYLVLRYKPDEASIWLPLEGAVYYHIPLSAKGNTATTKPGESDQWHPVAPLKEPIARLAPLVSKHLPLIEFKGRP